MTIHSDVANQLVVQNNFQPDSACATNATNDFQVVQSKRKKKHIHKQIQIHKHKHDALKILVFSETHMWPSFKNSGFVVSSWEELVNLFWNHPPHKDEEFYYFYHGYCAETNTVMDVILGEPTECMVLKEKELDEYKYKLKMC